MIRIHITVKVRVILYWECVEGICFMCCDPVVTVFECYWCSVLSGVRRPPAAAVQLLPQLQRLAERQPGLRIPLPHRQESNLAGHGRGGAHLLPRQGENGILRWFWFSNLGHGKSWINFGIVDLCSNSPPRYQHYLSLFYT